MQIGLATIGVCIFCAVTSVAALFYLIGSCRRGDCGRTKKWKPLAAIFHSIESKKERMLK